MPKQLFTGSAVLFLILAGCRQAPSGAPPTSADDSRVEAARSTVGSLPVEKKSPPEFQLRGVVVRRILQDKAGALWFGTNGKGAFRYDGKKVEQFLAGKDFGSIAVREMVEDEQGNIWFGTSDGLVKFDGEAFTRYTTKDGLVDDDIWSIEIDRGGTVWVGTLQGVSRFDGNGFVQFELPAARPDPSRGVTSGRIVHCIMEDSKGRMWFGTNGGAYIHDGRSLTKLSKEDGLVDNAVNGILEDKFGNIWFATHHQGVCRWDGKSFTATLPSDGVQGTEAWKLYSDSRGNIWFPIEHAGVYRYDGQKFTRFHRQDGLECDGVQCVFEDRDGHLWIGGWMALYRYDGNAFFSHWRNA